jgi:hypothetical protein
VIVAGAIGIAIGIAIEFLGECFDSDPDPDPDPDFERAEKCCAAKT